jgi:hypothetical protein
MKSHKTRTTPPWVHELIEREDEIEACGCALFGPSHAKYRDQIKAVFAHAFKQGRTVGWRAAKGLKEPAKKRGRPSEIHEGERNLLISVVEERKPGQTIRAAVSRFLHAMQAGERINHRSLKSSVSRALQEGKRIEPQAIEFLRQTPRGPITSAVVNKAVRAHYRHCRQKKLP